MAVQIEGFGEDWVVTRRSSDAKPELSTVKSIDEFRRVMQRLLLKSEQRSGATSLPIAPLPAAPMQVVAEPIRQVSVAVTRPPVRTSPPRVPNVVPPHRRPAPILSRDLTLDCMTCGACCAPADQTASTHVLLAKQDCEVIPPGRRRVLVVEKGGDKFVNTKQNAQGKTVCSALSGIIGHQCSCSIYEHRPAVCRLFEPGSPECLQARRLFKVGDNG